MSADSMGWARRILACAGWLLLASSARAECIRLLVRDPEGLPVAGARVESGNASAGSGADGAAMLCGVARGRLKVRIEAAEFTTAVVEAEAPGEQTITLGLAPRVESPVVVTGTPEPRQLAEVDRSITVIPVENAVAPGDSLAALLKTDAAVDVRERGPDGTQADVGIRGATFSQTLVLVDGIRVNDAQSGHHNLDLPLPPENVSRMEVLHGSGSTLYGSDATGGAINVITRRPAAGELSVSSGLGDFGWNREAVSGGFRLGRWGQQLGLSRDFSTGFRTGRDYRNLAAAGETFVDEPFGSTSVLLAYNDRPFGAEGFYGDYPSWEKTGTTLVAVRQTVGEHHFTLSYRRHRDHYVLFRDQPEVFQNFHTDQSWEAGYAYHRAISAQTQFTGGVEGISESITSTNLGDHQRSRASGYFVLEARPVARLTVTAGLREEVYRTWRGVASPTLAAGLRIAGGLKARASAGHAFRIPTYTELYYHDPANVGNPNLRPESAWTYEAGLDWWGPRGMTVSATWFERRERDTIDFVRPAGASIWEAMNFERLHFHGGQVEWRQKVRHAEVGASYTIIRASRELQPGVASQYVFDFPQNSVALTARAPLGRWAAGRVRFGAFNRSWQRTVPLWDAIITGQGSRVQPFFEVSNLLNTYYEDFPGLAEPGRWIRGGVKIRVLGGQ